MPGQSAAPTAPTTPSGPLDHNAPPPDPTTATIKDDQGNPSKGLIGAITDGLHWLGDHLGLSSSAQAGTLPPAIAHDPQTQTNRQQFVGNHPDGDTYFTHENAEELKKYADPDGQLGDAYGNIAALEAGWKYAVSRGDTATAGRLAASILHYDVLTSQNLSAEAAHALYNGDKQGAVDKINQASDALPDGRLVHATYDPKTDTVTVTGSNLNGEELWRQRGAAATVLEHATALGRSGKLQWDSLESQAAKYDSTFADMVKNRNKNASDDAIEARQNRTWQHQQDVLDAKEAARQKAAEDEANKEAEFYRTQNQPAIPATPTAPTPTTPTAPTSPATTTASATTPAPPATPTATPTTATPTTTTPTTVASATTPTTDATAPTGAGGKGITGHGGGLPGPTGADIPTAAATPVDFERMEDNARQQSATAIQARYADEAKNMPPPPRRPDENPNFVSLSANGKANAWRDYNAQANTYKATVQDLHARMNTEIAKADKDISDRIAVRRQTQANADLQTRQEAKEGRERTYKGQDEATAQTNKLAVIDYADKIKRAEPRNPTEANAELAGEDPRISLAQSFLPDAAKQGTNLTGDAAGTALVAAGFDPGVQQQLIQARHAAFMNSPLATKEEVARGVMLFASGMPGAGVLDERTGVRHVAVSDDKGYASTFSVPESVYQNLKIMNAKGRYAADTKAAIANAPPPEARPSTVRASQAPMAAPQDIGGPGWYRRTHPAISPTP
jgi:hypothetical protein